MDTTLFLSYYFKRQKLDPKPVKKKKNKKQQQQQQQQKRTRM